MTAKKLLGATVLWVLSAVLWQVVRVLFDYPVDIESFAASIWFGFNAIIFTYGYVKLNS